MFETLCDIGILWSEEEFVLLMNGYVFVNYLLWPGYDAHPPSFAKAVLGEEACENDIDNIDLGALCWGFNDVDWYYASGEEDEHVQADDILVWDGNTGNAGTGWSVYRQNMLTDTARIVYIDDTIDESLFAPPNSLIA